MNPIYPIYIPSKGRANVCLTAQCLAAEGVPFRLVVEPQEAAAYAARFGAERLLILPFSNLGQGSIPARNWIKAHSTAQGDRRHWQLDDNIASFRRRYKARRIRCAAGAALAIAEEFTDRYTNIAIAGLNYAMFAYAIRSASGIPPYHLNCRVYSCALVLNSIPYGWRGRYNEDTDICLQVLAGGWCTVLFNAFLCEKMRTMTMKGGNAAELYQGDGRLKMARSLERVWPGVVSTGRRFKRPQHVVKDAWRRFDTPLQPRPDLDLASLPAVDEHGLALIELAPIQSESLRRVLAEQRRPALQRRRRRQ